LVREIRRGSFNRSVALSSDLKTAEAKADFANGIVTLTIPKAEQAKPRHIRIGSGQTTSQVSETTSQSGTRELAAKK